jgi:hypothetical protein
MVKNPVQDQTPEFQIQQEDFPALPGAQSKYYNSNHIILDSCYLLILHFDSSYLLEVLKAMKEDIFERNQWFSVIL